jgi:hypothetical protein
MKSMRVVQGMSQSLCIVPFLLTCDALYAQNEDHRARNLDLQEPETSFADDDEATKRLLWGTMWT